MSEEQARLDAIRQECEVLNQRGTTEDYIAHCRWLLDLLTRQSEALEVVTAERDMWRDQLRGERHASETLRQDIKGLRGALLEQQKKVGKIAFAETHAFDRA